MRNLPEMGTLVQPVSFYYAMTTDQIRQLIRENRVADFYNDRKWRALQAKVLHDQHYECQYCKDSGKYTRAKYVHHVNHLRDHPELAYSEHYIDVHGKKQRNLVACCFDCHEAQHPDRFRKRKKVYLNEERW